MCFSLIIYIIIYILISYIEIVRNRHPLFLIDITDIDIGPSRSLLTHFLLYQAFQRFAEFEGYAPGIAFEVEALAANLCGLEVRVVAAVRPARHGDELAAEDVRIAFACVYGYKRFIPNRSLDTSLLLFINWDK